MKLTDIFIQRPVLAIVVSALILLFGLRAIHNLPLRQFPTLENTVITVQTAYPGADAKLIQGFITTPLEKALAGADGIDYITSTSNDSSSMIQAHILLNYSPDKAFTSIMSKVAAVRGQLPRESEDPIVMKETGAQIALMYIGFNSSDMSPAQITDYMSRVVQPSLATIPGIANAEILGGSVFAMRIWLDPMRMAALEITSSDVAAALQAKNFLTAAGKTKGEYVAYTIAASTDLHTIEEFNRIVIKDVNHSFVHLQDIAKVELGAQSYESSITFNGKPAIFLAVNASPGSNPLTVIDDVYKILPQLQKNFPASLHAKVVYDATQYIKSSIHEVISTLLEATLIVVLVIYLFLGSIRTVMIPVVTIPLSLIGVCSLMLILGYSLNLLTLLAMVLAIGLVVDDAIVVVENIHRHIEAGMTAFQAAIQGAREIALPIVAMTITLAAVYAPIGFMSGMTGALFKEFAFTLASAVIISGIVALTLSPMMSSLLFSQKLLRNRLVHTIDQLFDNLKARYQKSLNGVLMYRPVVLVFSGIIIVACYFLFITTPQELAPDEDQSVLFVSATAPNYANIDYMTAFSNEISKIFKQFPEMEDYFIVNGMGSPNNAIGGIILKPWEKRNVSQAEINGALQAKLTDIAGLQSVIFPLPSLPTGDDGLPVEFVVLSTQDYPVLYEMAQKLTTEAQKSGLFMFVSNNLKFEKPQIQINIDRNKAADLGISMQDIGIALTTSLGGGNINRFSMEGRSYDVIPQLLRQYRLNPEQLNTIYVRTGSGELVPLSTIITLEQQTQPNSLMRFNQLNATTIQGMMTPGVTLGKALNFLETKANAIFTNGVLHDYSGQSRKFIKEGNALVFTFFFAIIVIYLVLAAQFESFRDPLIILVSVPLSICGALIPLNVGLASINIYTEIGLITLIGLISKHGILMVEFANKLQQQENLNLHDAISKAASIRLRPILMTTAAMILGVLPLLFASGAGAASRYDIGLVIATGLFIGTFFTLFVVPTMYTYIAKKHHPKEM